MKKYLFGAMLVTLTACSSPEPEAVEQLSDNIAYQDSTVRFSVITNGVIRMEYSPEGKFVDDASFIASERLYPISSYSIKEENGILHIITDKMSLSYRLGSGPFDQNNLNIVSSEELSTQFNWHPGDVQQANLGGTYRTLDGYDGNIYWSWSRNSNVNKPLPLEDGILARDGWTLIDDSKGLLFDHIGDGDLDWVKSRQENSAQDFYFMAYGHDYKRALKDYTTFAGRIPLPPRFTFGYWWSRYWSYSDAEMRKLVNDFEAYGIPLDVLVVDMDWHWTEAGKGGWTGYTWNRRLFPNPKKFLDFLKSRGLKITLNLHPADGVPAYEDKYVQLAEFLGRDPKSTETIKWQSSNRRFMRGWLDKMLKPLEEEGVDFWWLDWQQKLEDDSIPQLSNTWWINYSIFTDQELNADHRPILYHRWGGLGNHRYQIGFSGDTYSTWASLAYQPYFNTTAANVGYGYWSHDIGGHMFSSNNEELDKELYTRWMQLGTFLPVMRSHSTKTPNMKKEPWNLGQPYMPAVTETILQRYRLAPYIYSIAREAYETGVSLCRPLYYDYPEDDRSYSEEFRNEYLFGPNMLVAPIVSPMIDGISTLNIFLPDGDWYEVSTGTLLKGGQVVERKFLLDEYPLYVKAGSIVPEYGKVKNLEANNNKVTLVVAPTVDDSCESEFSIYEDAGNDKDYATKYATTLVKNTISNNLQTITIEARKGQYDGMPKSREYAISLRGAAIPESVKMNGKAVDFEYDGTLLAVIIELGDIDPNRSYTVEITYPSNALSLNNGLVGKFRRIKNAMTEMKFHDAGINYIEGFGELGSVAEAIEYSNSDFSTLVEKFNANYNRLPELIELQKMKDEDKEWFLKSIIY